MSPRKAMPELVLASGSPRRSALLAQISVPHRVHVPDVDESVLPGESPEDYVTRVSGAKMVSSRAALGNAADMVILCADTIVELDGEILGKPVDERHGLAMLDALSGRVHRVMTAVTIGNADREETFVVLTEVQFRTLDADECRRYWQTGEPVDKAGGYGAQGIGAIFVDRIVGSYSNVVGLPLTETALVLRRFGIDCLAAETE